MEYLKTIDLHFLTTTLKKTNHTIPIRITLKIITQSSSTLDTAYNRPPIPKNKPLQIIHQNIKPNNIILDTHKISKILDFNITQSKIKSHETNTQKLQFNNIKYITPEHLFFEPETPTSNVYSLNTTLYKLLTQERLNKTQNHPDQHTTHLTDRLSFIQSQITTPNTVTTELKLLIQKSLNFEHEKHPTTTIFHQQTKTLTQLTNNKNLPN